jgi:zinc protease
MSVSAPAPLHGNRSPFAEAVRHRTLSNGARFYVLENHFNPTLAISGSLRAGRLYAPPDRRLIASVTAGELLKGTARRTKMQLAEDLESRAVSLSLTSDASDPVGVDISGAALSRETGVLLEALAEVLRTPTFPEDELEKEKKRLVGSIRQQQDQTSIRAYERAMARIYPPPHPLHRLRGPERIGRAEALTRRDLETFYAERYGAGSFVLVVVGDVDAERLLDRLEADFGDWAPGPPTPIAAPSVPPVSPGSEIVHMPDKASADVVIVSPADLRRMDEDFLACSLANAALGQSSLTSRLGVRVRDTEGLTYGIHSSISATHVAGPFAVSLTVKPESRDAAVASALDEVRKFLREGITDKELAEEKSSRIGRFKVDLGSNSGIADALDAAVYYGFGVTYLDEFPSKVAAVTREQADAAFARRVRPEDFTIVSAGSFVSGAAGAAAESAGSAPSNVKESRSE